MGASEAAAILTSAFEAEMAVKAAEDGYRPQLTSVRRIEKNVRREEEHLKEMKTNFSRMQADNPDRPALEEKIAKSEATIAELKAQVPATWEDVHATFAKLTKAENDARTKYRRAADAAWESPLEALDAMNGSADYLALEAEFLALRDTVTTGGPAETQELVNAMSKKFSAIGETNDVKKALGKARRKLKSKTPNIEDALKEYDKAIAAYDTGKIWRAEAETKLRGGLENYLAAIKVNLGARMQPGLEREQALFLASCSAHHRDISLNF